MRSAPGSFLQEDGRPATGRPLMIMLEACSLEDDTTSGHRCHVGIDQLLLFPLRHFVVVEGAHDLRADLGELVGREVEILVGFVQRQAGVSKGPPAKDATRGSA